MGDGTRQLDATVRTETPTIIDSGSISRGATEPELFAAGDTIAGRYLVERLLGRGGFGEVYAVRDERSGGKPVALKLARLLEADSLSLETLRGEFSLLATLSHPNLAEVYDFGHVRDDVAYFTQALVHGVPLGDSRLRPDDPEAIPLWAQLCRALEYLHGRGILHRDIKPSNIMVDRERGQLTLLDFGISRAFGPSRDRVLLGTYSYMPPEAIQGGPVDARADLYSLGVALYKMLTGRVPFSGKAEAILIAHMQKLPPPISANLAKPEVARVVERLLCKDPGARLASAGELLRALAAANGVNVEAERAESLASYVLSGRFVGHEAALVRLVEAVAVQPAAGGVELVVGEAGTGKSRLMREARQRAQLARRTWIDVQAQPTWEAKSVLPSIARAVLDAAVSARLHEPDRRALARALPELRKKGERFDVAVDPARARMQRIEALARAMRLRFDGAPGVLAIDDVHWSGTSAVGLLTSLVHAARAEGAAVIFVLAARPGEAAEGLAAEFGEPAHTDYIEPQDSARLIESMFGTSSLLEGTELGESLAAQPHPAQHVQESLRLALETGAIARRAEHFVVTRPIAALSSPEVLAQRLRRVDAKARKALLALAVLRGDRSVVEVGKVSKLPLSACGERLGGLVRAGLVEEWHDARARVRYTLHDRYRDVVVSMMSPGSVGAAHRRAGAELLRRGGGDWRGLLDAAEHFAAAGAPSRAVRTAAKAAREAERAGRPDQALLVMDREIEWRRSTDELDVQTWLHYMAAAHRAARRDLVDSALSALSSARSGATVSERLDIDAAQARAALDRGEPAQARAIIDQALGVAQQASSVRHAAELHLLAAKLEEDFGDVIRARAEYERAAELARESRDRAREAEAYVGASLAALRAGAPVETEGLAEQALAAARKARRPLLVAEALRHLGSAARESGSVKKALTLYRRSVKAAREGGSAESEAKGLNNLGTVCQWLGLIPEAVEALERSLTLKRELGLFASAHVTHNNLGGLLIAVGRLEAAETQLNAVIAAPDDAAPIVAALARSNLGDLCLIRGDIRRACDLFAEANAMNQSRSLALQQTHAACGRIRALLLRRDPGDVAEAHALAEQLRDIAGIEEVAESRRRFRTTTAIVLDFDGRPADALHELRRLRDGADAEMHFSDALATSLEIRWLEVILLGRLGRTAAAAAAARRTRSLLHRLAKRVGDAEASRVYLETHPLHRAIDAGKWDTARGTTWFSAPEA